MFLRGNILFMRFECRNFVIYLHQSKTDQRNTYVNKLLHMDTVSLYFCLHRPLSEGGWVAIFELKSCCFTREV